MKTIKTLLAIAVLATSSIACKNDTQPEVKTIGSNAKTEVAKKLDPNATYAKAEFKIDGMTCAMGCAKSIEKNMAKMDGVKSAKVDFDRKLAMVEYDEAVVTPKSLEEAVSKTGEAYKAIDIHTVDEFTEVDETPEE